MCTEILEDTSVGGLLYQVKEKEKEGFRVVNYAVHENINTLQSIYEAIITKEESSEKINNRKSRLSNLRYRVGNRMFPGNSSSE